MKELTLHNFFSEKRGTLISFDVFRYYKFQQSLSLLSGQFLVILGFYKTVIYNRHKPFPILSRPTSFYKNWTEKPLNDQLHRCFKLSLGTSDRSLDSGRIKATKIEKSIFWKLKSQFFLSFARNRQRHGLRLPCWRDTVSGDTSRRTPRTVEQKGNKEGSPAIPVVVLPK